MVGCFFLLIIGFLALTASAARTSKWDSCNCHWDTWQPWSQCTETCGGGYQRRERKIWHHNTPGCDEWEDCISPSEEGEGYEGRGCNKQCMNGGTFTAYSKYSGFCRCPKGKKGSCCEQIVDCGTPSAVSNGRFTGNDFTYGHVITYVCDTDYNMTDPALASRTCSEFGYWTGSSPQCLYAISCSSDPCQNGASCENLLGDYVCTCLDDGWTGKNCETDILPPIFENCTSSRDLFVSNVTIEQTWEEPTFSDPHNFSVQVTQNFKKPIFDFPWGVHTIQYTGTKPSNGLSATCAFNISVKPYPCDTLEAPVNGIVACNGWNTNYTNICKYFCLDGYTFPPGYKSEHVYNCGASGHWLPSPVLPGCVSTNLLLTPPGFTIANCTSEAEKKIIAEEYIRGIEQSSFNQLCTQNRELCTVDNVNVSC